MSGLKAFLILVVADCAESAIWVRLSSLGLALLLTAKLVAQQPELSREEATRKIEQIWKTTCESQRAALEQEWNEKAIQVNDKTLKFVIRKFGDVPESGRSLFISMHGGGGTLAQVND
jgi:hypothetical protein